MEHILHLPAHHVPLVQLGLFLTLTNPDATLVHRGTGLPVETMSVDHVKAAQFPLADNRTAPTVTLVPNQMNRNRNVGIVLPVHIHQAGTNVYRVTLISTQPMGRPVVRFATMDQFRTLTRQDVSCVSLATTPPVDLWNVIIVKTAHFLHHSDRLNVPRVRAAISRMTTTPTATRVSLVPGQPVEIRLAQNVRMELYHQEASQIAQSAITDLPQMFRSRIAIHAKQEVMQFMGLNNVFHVKMVPILRRQARTVFLVQLDLFPTPTIPNAILVHRAAGLTVETMCADNVKMAQFPLADNRTAPIVTLVPYRMNRNRNVGIVLPVSILQAVCNVFHAQMAPILHRQARTVFLVQLDMFRTPTNPDATLVHRAAGLTVETMCVDNVKRVRFPLADNRIAPIVTLVPYRMNRNRNVGIVLPVSILQAECNVFHMQMAPILYRQAHTVFLVQLDMFLTPTNPNATLVHRGTGLTGETMCVDNVKMARFPLADNRTAQIVTLVRNRTNRSRNVGIVLPVSILQAECNVFHAQMAPILHRQARTVLLVQLDMFRTPTNQDATLVHRGTGLTVETMCVDHVTLAHFLLGDNRTAPNVTLEPHRIKSNQHVRIVLRDSTPPPVMPCAVLAHVTCGRHQDQSSVMCVNWVRCRLKTKQAVSSFSFLYYSIKSISFIAKVKHCFPQKFGNRAHTHSMEICIFVDFFIYLRPF